MLIGHFLCYLRRSDEDEDAGLEPEILPLHLGYGSYQEALAAKQVLETLYGVGNIEIDTRVHQPSLVE